MIRTGITSPRRTWKLTSRKRPGDVSPSARYWAQDVVDPEWTMDDGLVDVPWDRPGLGVTVDAERVESLTVRSEVCS